MKITSGTLGGRTLIAPEDERVRPTADRVRQAMFNILAHNDFGGDFALEDARVADLFAGTGALGIEAVSRGASFCLFVDDDAESRGLIRQNVEALGLTGTTKIWRRDATDLGPINTGSGGPFDLVFIDPPYHTDLLPRSLHALHEGAWLAPSAIIVAEMAEEDPIPETPGYRQLDERIYGTTRVLFLTRS